MKKILSYITVAAAGLSSCNAFLDEPMMGDYSSSTIYSTEEQAQLAVNAIYNAAAYSINLWKFGDIPSDDSVKGGNAGDQADIGYIDEWNVLSDNGAVSEFWQNTYETVGRANNVIAGLESSSIDAESKAELAAEAKFLRAYSYFQLVNIFGEVPLKLKPQTSAENVNVGLSSVEDVYSQIESDLSEAASVLPSAWTATEAGRATSGAAYGLLAKSQLYQEKWSEALSSISSLKTLNLYELDEYADLFKLGADGESNADSKESVWAVRFMSGQVPAVGNALNQWFAPAEENGYYFNAPTDSWLSCFDERQTDGQEDLRIDLSVGRAGHEWLNGDTFLADWSPSTGMLVRKHNQPLSEVEAGKKGDGGLAYIYLRYADILLMEAECQNELGNPALAESPLNEVRERAGLSAISGRSVTEMRTLIRKERRRELGFEFHRFFDLMRWGKEAALSALGSDFPWTEPRYYFPLPQAELDSNSGITE